MDSTDRQGCGYDIAPIARYAWRQTPPSLVDAVEVVPVVVKDGAGHMIGVFETAFEEVGLQAGAAPQPPVVADPHSRTKMETVNFIDALGVTDDAPQMCRKYCVKLLKALLDVSGNVNAIDGVGGQSLTIGFMLLFTLYLSLLGSNSFVAFSQESVYFLTP